LPMALGEVLHIQTPSGGGWGEPFHRKPEDVLRDVANGLLSEDVALKLYGVHLEKQGVEWRIDEPKTTQYRMQNGKSGPQWDFGSGREAYERLWPRSLRDLLNELLREVPITQRHELKLKMHAKRQQMRGPVHEDVIR